MSAGQRTGGPAFPVQALGQAGMTLRDYFAGQALIGLLAGTILPPALPDDAPVLPGIERTAIDAYFYADALLEVRDR